MFDITSDYIYDNINEIFSEHIFESGINDEMSDKVVNVDRIGVAIVSEDPTVVMVNSYHLSPPEIVVGVVLLFIYGLLTLLATPINIIRDSTPVSYQVVRSKESSFLPAYAQGYNFRSNYIYPVAGLPRLHYLDEGDPQARHVLVLLHGEPFWSQAWIKLIPLLTERGYRLIIPDFIGFGKSDKFVDYRVYNTSIHKACLKGLLDHLNLDQHLTLVGHNWGWMIGAGLAKDFPNLFNRFVILNTNNLPNGELTLSRYRNVSEYARFAIMNAFFLTFNASIELLREWFPLSVLIKSLNINYTKQEIAAFLAPHRSVSECGGTTAFPLMVPIYQSHPEVPEMTEIRHFLARSNIPSLVAYSDKAVLPWLQQGDFVVGNREIFYSFMTNSAGRVHRVADGGHLIMYDQPQVIADLIINFIQSS